MSKKIIGIGLNTAIDIIVKVTNFQVGKILRAEKSFEFAAGKVINSARTLSQLDASMICFAFVGKESSNKFNLLKKSNLEMRLVPAQEKTRNNITILGGSGEFISHIQTEGYSVLQAEYDNLLTEVLETLDDDDIVILSGTIPMGLKVDLYQETIVTLKSKGAKVILDSSGDFLRFGIKAVPFVLKPNLSELNELLGVSYQVDDLQRIKGAVLQLNDSGIEIVIVSLGAYGAVFGFRSASQAFHGRYLPKINPGFGDIIGCGDAFVAGVAYGLLRDMSITEIMSIAIRAGTSNLFAFGPGNIDHAFLLKSKSDVEIREL